MCSVSSCGKPLSARSTRFCDDHLKAYRDRNQASMAKKRHMGRCLSCPERALTGRSRCEACLERYKQHEKYFRQRRGKSKSGGV